MRRTNLVILAVGVFSSFPAISAPKALSGYEIVVGESPVSADSQKQLRVACPPGKRALSAGWGVLDPTGAILEGSVTYFEPAYDGASWLTNAQNKSSFASAWKLRVRLVCANG